VTGVAVDPALEFLTPEQVAAAGTMQPRIFLEAAPGSGKTTVAAQRFGAQRYRPTRLTDGRVDQRAVLAVSFTRSATRELKGRVHRSWGPSALVHPHRIVTLDTVVCELLTRLLAAGLVHWPGGHRSLEVHDSWKTLVRHVHTRVVTYLNLVGTSVQVAKRYGTGYAMRPEPIPFAGSVNAGRCTHEDVRRVLEQALMQPDIAEALTRHLAATTRALIVDEVFDANELDIRVIELAARAGLDVTLIGDPWQALYGFRGARPDLVPALLTRTSMAELKLTRSFRWRSEEQQKLATDLRSGSGVRLPEIRVGGVFPSGAEVLLACLWADLWETSPLVLPLAWGSAKGNVVEAATTLLLNQVCHTILGYTATYLGEALLTLNITDQAAVERLEPGLQRVLELVAKATTKPQLHAAYDALIAAVQQESLCEFPTKAHPNYTKRLQRLQARLTVGEQIIPGMTVHQAKGREWDIVTLKLSDADVTQLTDGLIPTIEKHRQLYVACTRARSRTMRIVR
jgi:DNA helicase-2/ATP-dependent DNA helicase PcrA